MERKYERKWVYVIVCCLVGRRGNKTFVWGPDIFHLSPQKPFSPKWRENRGENVETCYVTKIPSRFLPCPHYIPHSIVLIYCFLLILFRMTFKFFFFLVIICLSVLSSLLTSLRNNGHVDNFFFFLISS